MLSKIMESNVKTKKNIDILEKNNLVRDCKCNHDSLRTIYRILEKMETSMMIMKKRRIESYSREIKPWINQLKGWIIIVQDTDRTTLIKFYSEYREVKSKHKVIFREFESDSTFGKF